MNNTQITLEPRYPFVPMFANGLPQADFYVNGITVPFSSPLAPLPMTLAMNGPGTSRS